MKNPRTIALLVGLGAFLLIFLSSVFEVSQVEQALVLRLGEPVRVISQPGLHAKIPFVEEVALYDIRILDLQPPELQVILADQKRLNVDTYIRYRIVDPLLFYQAMTTEDRARDRLTGLINSSLRRVLGRNELSNLLSAQRNVIMGEILHDVNSAAAPFGIDVIDARIGRADLPEETSEAIYNRMKSEREREAKQFRAEGYELSQQIRADADRQRVVVLADATRDSEIARGQADGAAIAIWAQATSQSPEFFDFYRSLKAYRKAFEEGGSAMMVLTPGSDFLRHFDPGAAGRK